MYLLKTTLISLALAASLPAQTDVKGSADHPVFPSRMPGYSISLYQQQGFGSYRFRTSPVTEVEGKYTRIHYYLKNVNEHPGGLAIRRNYENAIKKAGGVVLHSNDNLSVLRARKDGVEIWAEVQASNRTQGRIYFLHIVERTAMAQVITADLLASALDRDGFVALDVHFATGKTEILPESQPLIEEAAKMLKARPALRVGVEGHTDNVGTAAANQILSEGRARSVVAALSAAGIDAKRLAAAGFGQTKPVADNRSEEGRAKNRRVEIVKKN